MIYMYSSKNLIQLWSVCCKVRKTIEWNTKADRTFHHTALESVHFIRMSPFKQNLCLANRLETDEPFFSFPLSSHIPQHQPRQPEV